MPFFWHTSSSRTRPKSSISSGVRSETTVSSPALRQALISSSSQSPPRGRADISEPSGPRTIDPIKFRKHLISHLRSGMAYDFPRAATAGCSSPLR